MTAKVLRSRAKRWGFIFTCMTTRAIHLESDNSLSSDVFLSCFERFINRRGYPKKLVSDCGTSFVGASKEIADWGLHLEEDERLKHYAVQKSIEWQFNLPDAPHMGSAWEETILTEVGVPTN